MTWQLQGDAKNRSKVGIILPTYCEAQNIETLIKEIKRLPLNVTVLVIDDNSPDQTSNIVKKLQVGDPNLFLLERPNKVGLGSAITAGFKAYLSLKDPPEYVVTMDADYSHDPTDLPRIVAAMTVGHDLVIGSRYCKNGKTQGWSISRRIISRIANIVARRVLGLKLSDCTSGYRCYTINLLKQTIGFLHSQTYDIQIETVKQAHTQGFRIREIPILFTNRKHGKSKLTIREIENYLSYIFKTLAA